MIRKRGGALSLCTAGLIGIAASFAGVDKTLAAGFNIVGTGDGVVVLKALSTAYTVKYPGIVIGIPPSVGSGGGIAAVGTDREKIARVARSLSANELASGLKYHPIFVIPSVFFVHPEVPVRNLSADQLRDIYNGTHTNWQAVGGPDMRIRVVRREDADSTVLVLRAALPQFRDMKFTSRSKLALTTQEAISSVEENFGAIGFGPLSDLQGRNIVTLSLDGIAPTAAKYPAVVTLALVYKPPGLDAEARRYLAFLALPEAAGVIRRFGAVPTR